MQRISFRRPGAPQLTGKRELREAWGILGRSIGARLALGWRLAGVRLVFRCMRSTQPLLGVAEAASLATSPVAKIWHARARPTGVSKHRQRSGHILTRIWATLGIWPRIDFARTSPRPRSPHLGVQGVEGVMPTGATQAPWCPGRSKCKASHRHKVPFRCPRC